MLFRHARIPALPEAGGGWGSKFRGSCRERLWLAVRIARKGLRSSTWRVLRLSTLYAFPKRALDASLDVLRGSCRRARERPNGIKIGESIPAFLFRKPRSRSQTDATRKFHFADSAALRDGQRVRVTALERKSERRQSKLRYYSGSLMVLGFDNSKFPASRSAATPAA